MSAQIGGLADEKLYSHSAGSNNEADELATANNDNDREGNNPSFLERRLNADKAIDSRAARIKSAATTPAKKLAYEEVKKKIISRWLISAIASVASLIISYLGFLLLPIIVIFLIIILVPGGAWIFNFVSKIKAVAG